MNYIYFFVGGVLLFGIVLLALVSRNPKSPKRKESLMHSSNIKIKWESLQKARSSNNLSSLRHAVITADKLVDHTLRLIHTPGNSLGERAKNARTAMGDTYEKFWDAHRTRNRLVHEVDVDVRPHEAKTTLDKYEEVLKQLGIIH